jgi:hypothetical protein
MKVKLLEHLLDTYLLSETAYLRGFIFGLVHVSIMLTGYYTGWSINRFLKLASNGYVAGIIGAAFAHVIADIIAASIDPHLRSSAFGIAIGGLVPLALVPILEKYMVKSKHHIVVGDHEDIAKDLASHQNKEH